MTMDSKPLSWRAQGLIDWQRRSLASGRFTEQHFLCAKCGYSHSIGAKMHTTHQKYKLTSAMWLGGVAKE